MKDVIHLFTTLNQVEGRIIDKLQADLENNYPDTGAYACHNAVIRTTCEYEFSKVRRDLLKMYTGVIEDLMEEK